MAHAHCMLDTQGYRHTLRVCNTYWFSTAAMVARALLNVTLYYTACTLNYILATTISSTLETNFSRSSSKNRFYRTVLDGGSQDSSVALVTWLRAGRTRNCGSIPARSKIFFSARRPDRLHGPPSPLLNVCQEIFLRSPKRQGREADHYLHLVRRLRMCGDLTFPTTVWIKEYTETTNLTSPCMTFSPKVCTSIFITFSAPCIVIHTREKDQQ
jgi:hypothetical protein